MSKKVTNLEVRVIKDSHLPIYRMVRLLIFLCLGHLEGTIPGWIRQYVPSLPIFTVYLYLRLSKQIKSYTLAPQAKVVFFMINVMDLYLDINIRVQIGKCILLTTSLPWRYLEQSKTEVYLYVVPRYLKIILCVILPKIFFQINYDYLIYMI